MLCKNMQSKILNFNPRHATERIIYIESDFKYLLYTQICKCITTYCYVTQYILYYIRDATAYANYARARVHIIVFAERLEKKTYNNIYI